MAEGPLLVILEMIQLVVVNTITTLWMLTEMSIRLLSSIMWFILVGGPTGFALGAIIIGVVSFFLLKFSMASAKTVVTLVIAAFLIIFFLMWGLAPV